MGTQNWANFFGGPILLAIIVFCLAISSIDCAKSRCNLCASDDNKAKCLEKCSLNKWTLKCNNERTHCYDALAEPDIENNCKPTSGFKLINAQNTTVKGENFYTIDLPLEMNISDYISQIKDGYLLQDLTANSIILPGGHFREYYCCDSLWKIKGLLASGCNDSANNMIEKFMELVKNAKFGFIPNEDRVYYEKHSQPPLLITMAYEYYNKFKTLNGNGNNGIEFLQNMESLCQLMNNSELYFKYDNAKGHIYIYHEKRDQLPAKWHSLITSAKYQCIVLPAGRHLLEYFDSLFLLFIFLLITRYYYEMQMGTSCGTDNGTLDLYLIEKFVGASLKVVLNNCPGNQVNQCCYQHDTAYCDSSVSQIDADEYFCRCLRQIQLDELGFINKQFCSNSFEIMCVGVRIFGHIAHWSKDEQIQFVEDQMEKIWAIKMFFGEDKAKEAYKQIFDAALDYYHDV